MRTLVPLACTTALLAGHAFPQGKVAPHKLTPFSPSAPFSASAWGASGQGGAGQIHLVPFPGRPGKFLVSMTLTSLTGGKGKYDLVTGLYDATTRTGTPDRPNLAAALNTRENEFGMTIYHTGLLAVYESAGKPGANANQVWLATRTSPTAAWRDRGRIGNMPQANNQSYWDPSLADIGGRLHLIYLLKRGTTGAADIAAAPLDMVKSSIDRSRERVLVRTTTTSGEANSPTPIVDSSGELIGLSHHDNQNANDHYMSFDLDPATPALPFISDPAWINNGGYAAGTFFDSKGVAPYSICSVESVWWTGGRAPVGGKMEISFYAPIRSSAASPTMSFALLSTGFLKKPSAVPGIRNELGLNPALLVPLGSPGMHNLKTGRFTMTVAIPRDPALAGVAIPAQSVSYDPKGPGGPEYYFGNTAALTIF